MDKPQSSDIIFYNSPQGNVRIEVLYVGETFWLSQKRMAELFGVDVRTVSEHLGNIFTSGELEADSTVRIFRIVQKEGSRDVSREVEFYNLDAIIADAGKISHEVAKKLAEEQYEKFRVTQDKNFESDFDKEIKKIKAPTKKGKNDN